VGGGGGDQQERGRTREGNGQLNIIKIFCMHVGKCHNRNHYFVESIRDMRIRGQTSLLSRKEIVAMK
jgi:hypothetical protein